MLPTSHPGIISNLLTYSFDCQTDLFPRMSSLQEYHYKQSPVTRPVKIATFCYSVAAVQMLSLLGGTTVLTMMQ
eukprot:391745-Amphidinium_carterae.1